MKIGVDIDDCITKTVDIYCEIANTLLELSIKSTDILHLDGKIESTGLISTEQMEKINEEIYRRRAFRDLEIHTDCKEVLTRLHNSGEEIILVTSRDNYLEIEEDTKFWLQKEGILYDGLILAGIKGPAISENGIDVFIDDRISYIEEAVNAGAKGIIFTQPWNKSYKPGSEVERARNWLEIERVLQDYKRKIC